jgi:hypothetical protein
MTIEMLWQQDQGSARILFFIEYETRVEKRRLLAAGERSIKFVNTFSEKVLTSPCHHE